MTLLESERKNINAQKMMVTISVLLLLIKFAAYFLTRSNAILSDALESIVNVTAGSFTLYSLIFSSYPKDENHPYGHGKIEFISAGIEGTLIFIAGAAIIVKAIYNFFEPAEIQKIDIGIYLSVITCIVNFYCGAYLIKLGKTQKSMPLVAGGQHLKTDAYSTVGMVLGLIVLYATKIFWIDNLLAIFFGVLIVVNGMHIMSAAINKIMDSADEELLKDLSLILEKNRVAEWVDVHNLKVIHFGTKLHVDAHVTLPRYFDLDKTHDHLDRIDLLIRDHLKCDMEFFIHPDPCIPSSCILCQLENCPVRSTEFKEKVVWTNKTLVAEKRHSRRKTHDH